MAEGRSEDWKSRRAQLVGVKTRLPVENENILVDYFQAALEMEIEMSIRNCDRCYFHEWFRSGFIYASFRSGVAIATLRLFLSAAHRNQGTHILSRRWYLIFQIYVYALKSTVWSYLLLYTPNAASALYTPPPSHRIHGYYWLWIHIRQVYLHASDPLFYLPTSVGFNGYVRNTGVDLNLLIMRRAVSSLWL